MAKWINVTMRVDVTDALYDSLLAEEERTVGRNLTDDEIIGFFYKWPYVMLVGAEWEIERRSDGEEA